MPHVSTAPPIMSAIDYRRARFGGAVGWASSHRLCLVVIFVLGLPKENKKTVVALRGLLYSRLMARLSLNSKLAGGTF
jgi:hypothetical protein